MQMLIKLNMSPRNALLHALCIYHIPYKPYTILMWATTNKKRNQQLDWVRVKWGNGKEGNGKPQFMLLCRTSKCFSIISDSFRHLSPAAGSRQRQFSLLGQVNHNNTARTPKLQMKPRAGWVGGGGQGGGRARAEAERTILLAKQKVPHFLTRTICQIATTIAALRLGRNLRNWEGIKTGRGEVNYFTLR